MRKGLGTVKFDAEKPPALNVYQDAAVLLNDLDDEGAGKVIKAGVSYFYTGEFPENLSAAENLVFNRLREGLDYAYQTWIDRRTQAAEAAQSRWHKKRSNQE